MTERAAAADARADELRALVDHELRTPLTVIAGFAELLLTRHDDATRREAPLRILEAVDRLSGGIDDLLANRFAARTGAGGIETLAVWEGEQRDPARVIVVDDDATIRRLIQLTLPLERFVVVEARDGNEALAEAADCEPALVVLDWRMPGTPGEDVLRGLKRSHPDTPVLVLTAERDPAHRETAEALGADEFLTKPFSPLQLLGAVENLLDRSPRPE